MKITFMLVCLLSLLTLLSKPCYSTTVVVDGVSKWVNPSAHIGDSIIFKHKYHYNLYIFQNEGAFNLCNFTQATLLSKPNSTSFTWHPSRPGLFYFSFNNGTLKPCQEGQKLAIKVSPTPAENPAISTSPALSPMAAPAPISGGVVSSTPAYRWPLGSSSPSPAPSANSPATISGIVPDKGGGIPFINSNPAVPLPTGEVDSATIRPLPTSGQLRQQVVGLLAAVQMPLYFVVFQML
ncbi:hypothetical protein L1049_025996 [Liquidambar formosana]|uniref:Uncharacterized protein n=1 Tax=Liquidambar formosana TaxID=63359 RepID=A0AAP0R533_LIQFO